jgi:two-component system response regulator AlgR
MIPTLLIVDDEEPARARLKMLLDDIAADFPHRLAGEAASAAEALAGIDACVDVVLLDIHLPETDGMALAVKLKQLARPPKVIFVTAFDDHAVHAFELEAADYLLKPVRAERLLQALRRASTGFSALIAREDAVTRKRRHLTVQDKGKVFLVPLHDIVFLRAELKYVTLRTRDHEFLIEESLTALEEEFSDCFIRVHRNALVARGAIIGVERGMVADRDVDDGGRVSEGWHVMLRDVAERLPVSRRQWPAVKALVK